MSRTKRRGKPPPEKWFDKGRRRLVYEDPVPEIGKPCILRPETKREANQRVRDETRATLRLVRDRGVPDDLVLPEH